MTPIDDQMIEWLSFNKEIISKGYGEQVRISYHHCYYQSHHVDCSFNCDDNVILIITITWYVPGEYQREAA